MILASVSLMSQYYWRLSSGARGSERLSGCSPPRLSWIETSPSMPLGILARFGSPPFGGRCRGSLGSYRNNSELVRAGAGLILTAMRRYGVPVSVLLEIAWKDTAVPQMNLSFLIDAPDRDDFAVCRTKTGL